MADDERKTIAVSPETKDRLDKQGGKGDSYDDIIKRILDIVEKR